MDLINKKDISFLKIVQYGGHFSGFLYGRPAGYFEVCAEFIGNNAGKGCLTQPRRSVKKDMVQGIAPELRRFDINLQILFSLFLAYVFVQCLWADTLAGHDAVFPGFPGSCHDLLCHIFTCHFSMIRFSTHNEGRRQLNQSISFNDI